MKFKQIKKILGKEFSRDADSLRSVVNTLNIPKGSKVLDVGTGRGVIAIILAIHGYKTITGEPNGLHWADWKS